MAQNRSTSLTELQDQWSHLYREKLPNLAKKRDTAQDKWPVALDHCFARIILDNAVGKDRPWADVVKAPATKNMTTDQLQAALDLGEQICRGDANLVELDQRSLELRGKTKNGSSLKRKQIADTDEQAPSNRGAKQRKTDKDETQKQKMTGVWEAFVAAKTARKSPEEEEEALVKIRSIIKADKSLTPFRRLVLTLLTQVPRGRYTTYKEIAAAVPRISPTAKGSARAIGGAMRNNPFAPTVPCHRVVAADGKLGGFGGDWGEDGRFAKSKKQMLRDEGVMFNGAGKVIGRPFVDFKKFEL